MVGGSDDVVDGTTSSVVWCGMVIKPWVAMDVVGQVLGVAWLDAPTWVSSKREAEWRWRSSVCG